MDIRIIYFILILNFKYATCCFSQTTIARIDFIYTYEGVETPVAIDCTPGSFGWLSYQEHKRVKGVAFLDKFTKLFRELQPDTSISFIDARIMGIITYNNQDKKDTICFGEHYGIDLNGTFMKDSPELLLLVKKEVWPCRKPLPVFVFRMPHNNTYSYDHYGRMTKVNYRSNNYLEIELYGNDSIKQKPFQPGKPIGGGGGIIKLSASDSNPDNPASAFSPGTQIRPETGLDITDIVPLFPKGYVSTDYCSNIIYETGKLKRILTSEGYITITNNTPTYHFIISKTILRIIGLWRIKMVLMQNIIRL